ncbi:MAG: glutathione S-transferase [Rhodobacteraceae bacterium]|nr:glutathione S-transferase [Paracoccaceae bacterium]
MRARLAVAASGLQVELREILLRDKPACMLEASPKGTVPVMVLPDGTVLEESFDIMEWALGQNDPQGLLAQGGQGHELIERCESEFKPHLDRFKYSVRYADVDPEHQRELASQYLRKLETRLQDHPYLFGLEVSLADIGIAPFVRQFANTDRGWFDAQPWPALHHWLEGFVASERFQQIMPKFPQWHPGDAATLFPTEAPNAP